MAHEPSLTVLLTAEQIRDRVRELAAEINEGHPAGQDLHLVSVLKGSIIFLADLVRALDRQVTIDFVAVASYGTGTRSSGVVKLVKDLENGIQGRHVLLVEDIVDTGQTLSWLRKALRARHPRSLSAVSLLDKPSRRSVEVDVEFVGFTIADQFVVGYGLDYAGQFRHLPYVAVLDQNREPPG
jgi:hypoxanthine phosphoribosyltransferase